jgi:hypothetical protein
MIVLATTFGEACGQVVGDRTEPDHDHGFDHDADKPGPVMTGLGGPIALPPLTAVTCGPPLSIRDARSCSSSPRSATIRGSRSCSAAFRRRQIRRHESCAVCFMDWARRQLHRSLGRKADAAIRMGRGRHAKQAAMLAKTRQPDNAIQSNEAVCGMAKSS